jgi:AcrR family transcriptional regulator
VAAADRRELERARRKQEILHAARAVFAQDGYNRATVDAVARRAELGKGTIYLYFDTKEAILAELTLQALGELGEQLQAAVDRCSPLTTSGCSTPSTMAGFKTASPPHSRNRF